VIFFAATENHGKAIHFGDLAVLDAFTAYTFFFVLRLEIGLAGSPHILSKGNATVDTNGWIVRGRSDEKLEILHGAGAGFTTSTSNTTALVVGATHRIAAVWSGTTLSWFRDGIADGSAAFSAAIAAATHDFTVGNRPAALALGFPGAIGQIAIFNVALSTAAIDRLMNGRVRPNEFASLKFWSRMHWNDASHKVRDEVSLTQGTYVGGTQPFGNRADPFDTFFGRRQLQGHHQIASHYLRRNSVAQPIYSADVPLHFGTTEQMALMNLSHDALPRATSLLSGLESHGLFDRWRRSVVRCVGIDVAKRERTATLELKDHENFAATLWSAELLTDGFDISGNRRVPQIDVGAEAFFDRNTAAYAHNPLMTTQAIVGSPGTSVNTVPIGVPKINHLGILSEEAATNRIQNPAWAAGFSVNWTANAFGGTIGNGTVLMFADLGVSANSLLVVSTGASSPPYSVSDAISLLGTDTTVRLQLWHSNRNTFGTSQWALQRASDSFWWNDATATWGSGFVWNTLTNNYDAATGRSPITRVQSKPITSTATTTSVLRLGHTQNSESNAGSNYYLAQLTKGNFIYSPIPVYNVATAADARSRVRTALPQIVFAGRGYVALRVRFEQESANLTSGDSLCFAYWQYGVNPLNFDCIVYENSGGTLRFAFKRFRDVAGTATLNAQATFNEANVVRGDTWEVIARWTSDSDGEMGLPARTMSIFVQRVLPLPAAARQKGVDAQASTNHSTTEVHTEFWHGGTPTIGGTTFLNAMNYVAPVVAVPRVLADEEAP
jgi:hypothetical protein